jgi:hypothetical protein
MLGWLCCRRRREEKAQLSFDYSIFDDEIDRLSTPAFNWRYLTLSIVERREEERLDLLNGTCYGHQRRLREAKAARAAAAAAESVRLRF